MPQPFSCRKILLCLPIYRTERVQHISEPYRRLRGCNRHRPLLELFLTLFFIKTIQLDSVRRPIRFRSPPDRIPFAVRLDSVRGPLLLFKLVYHMRCCITQPVTRVGKAAGRRCCQSIRYLFARSALYKSFAILAAADPSDIYFLNHILSILLVL